MPNWCENFLSVIGKKERLKEFDNAFKGFPVDWEKSDKEEKPIKPKYCLNAMYPVPKEVQNAGFHERGYDWCRANWGTKSDMIDVYDSWLSSDVRSYVFYTPWTPPIIWLKHIAKNWNELEFDLDYIECGTDFVGGIHIKGGVRNE